MAEIRLWNRKGQQVGLALCDDADLARLSAFNWFQTRQGYAVMYPKGQRPVLMHRMLLGLSYGDPLEADHVNGVRWDNRRDNIRAVTAAQNLQNKRVYKNSTTGVRGVYPCGSRFRGVVIRNGSRVFSAYFPTIELASEAVRAKRAELLPYSTN